MPDTLSTQRLRALISLAEAERTACENELARRKIRQGTSERPEGLDESEFEASWDEHYEEITAIAERARILDSFIRTMRGHLGE